jgi:hypothetical protein
MNRLTAANALREAQEIYRCRNVYDRPANARIEPAAGWSPGRGIGKINASKRNQIRYHRFSLLGFISFCLAAWSRPGSRASFPSAARP